MSEHAWKVQTPHRGHTYALTLSLQVLGRAGAVYFAFIERILVEQVGLVLTALNQGNQRARVAIRGR